MTSVREGRPDGLPDVRTEAEYRVPPGVVRGLLARGELLEPGHGSVEEILVTREGAAVVVLPERPRRPAGRQRARVRRVVAGEPEGVVRGEGAAAAGAGVPPVGGRVDDGTAAGLPFEFVAERLDPAHDPGLA